jgi:hypothetical protein
MSALRMFALFASPVQSRLINLLHFKKIPKYEKEDYIYGVWALPTPHIYAFFLSVATFFSGLIKNNPAAKRTAGLMHTQY